MKGIFEEIRSLDRDNVPTYRMFIGGEWVSAGDGKAFDVTNPATGKVIARVPRCTEADVRKTIEAAYNSKNVIKEIEPVERLEIFAKAREILLENKDDIINMIIEETGKPIAVAEGELKATAERLRLTMEEARVLYGQYIPGGWVEDTVGKFAIVIRRPRGVITAISPFNYPLFIPSAKLIPALLAANSVIAKPSSKTPVCVLMFCRILELAGIPKGCLNVVTGEGAVAGEVLAKSDKIDMITFTGSTVAGKELARMAGMKRLHLELGGKAAALILPDANLSKAAKECARGSFRNSGQRCDAISRVLVQEAIADKFIELLLAEASKYKIGDLRDRSTQIGPLIDQTAVERVDRLVKDAVGKGAKLLLGGGYKNLFYEPTMLDHVTTDMDIAHEEIFGPVIPVIRYKEIEEAVRISNSSRFGLDSCIFTENLTQAIEVSKTLEDGSVTINASPAHGVGHFPFGGTKESGIGREGLGYSIDEMTKIHTIVFSVKPKK